MMHSVKEIESPSHDWSADQWVTWIDEQVRERANYFMGQPLEMGGAYQRENNYASEYRGREIFELLQNADDAAADEGEKNKAKIIITKEGLCIANTGKPFSSGGIMSLIISDSSPKQFDRARYIGNKGLGFRSILSWTNSPFILSGNLSVGFDREYSESWLEHLCAQSAPLRDYVTKWRNNGVDYPVPVLAIPFLIGNQVISSPNYSATISLARKLRSQGYDTVIGIPFNNETAYNIALNQTNDFGQETLLFLQFLSALELESPSRTITWYVDRRQELVEISSSDSNMPLKVWKITSEVDTIPLDKLKGTQKSTPNYEIKLALREDGFSTGFLFNYLPTQVKFPFPFIAHITMNVSNNRQHLIEDEANEFLAHRLASLIATYAEQVAGQNEPWLPLSILSASKEIDLGLLKMGFLRALINEARNRKVIPVLGGQFVKPCDALYIDVDPSGLFPVEHFRELILHPSETRIDNFIESLDVKYIEPDDLRKRLNKSSRNLTVDQRAKIIARLTKAGDMPRPVPNILIDTENKIISGDSLVFLPPSEGIEFKGLRWINIRILHSELISILQSEFQVGSPREVERKLKYFSIREYSLNSIVSAVNARLNKRLKEQPDESMETCISGLKVIYSLFAQASKTSIPSRAERVRVPIPNRRNEIKFADELYFGKEYEIGFLTEALFGCFAPEKIVASPEVLDLGERSIDFLKWLGVADKPRISTQSYVEEGFKQFVRSRLSTPVMFDPSDYVVSNLESLSYFTLRVSSVENLEDIVKSAAPEAILAWIIVDDRLETWRTKGDSSAILSVNVFKKVKPRIMVGQTIPSYLIWYLENSKWLPASHGNKEAPSKCTFSGNLPEDLKAILPQPMINEQHQVFKEQGLDIKSLRSALNRIGVAPGLDDLSWDEFYKLLLELPTSDPVGKSARSLYRALIGRKESETPPNGPMRDKFLNEGFLFGRQGDTAKYFNSSELFYIDNTVLPEILCRQLPLLDLDKRRGALKVQRLFGVKSLQNQAVEITIDDFKETALASQFTNEIERLKPYIYALRIASDSKDSYRGRIKTLQIKLCKYASGKALVGDREFDISLESGESILCGEIAYVCIEPQLEGTELVLKDDLIADAVGEIFASILNLEKGSDFARMAICTPAKRKILLERLVGLDAIKILEEAKKKFDLVEKDEDETKCWVEPPSKEPESANNLNTNIEKAEVAGSAQGSSSKEPIDASDKTGSEVGKIEVEPKEHHVDGSMKVVQKRVVASVSSSITSYGLRRVVDYVKCQNVAFRFEESAGQGRYPLFVDHIHGKEGFGCDILSFKTNEDREKFKKNPDLQLVERFIEVKGSVNEKGIIPLAGNELIAANNYKNNFYLYRVYESNNNGEYEVVILENPLETKCRVVYEIDPFRSEKTQRWNVKEISEEAETDTGTENVNT